MFIKMRIKIIISFVCEELPYEILFSDNVIFYLLSQNPIIYLHIRECSSSYAVFVWEASLGISIQNSVYTLEKYFKFEHKVYYKHITNLITVKSAIMTIFLNFFGSVLFFIIFK